MEEEKIERSYDSLGKMLMYVSLRRGRDKHEYSYDSSGNMLMHASYSWDSGINDWKGNDYGKIEWEYDASGQLFQEIQYDFDNETQEWVKKIRYIADSDYLGDPTLLHQYSWNSDSKEWDIILRYFIHYKSSLSDNAHIALEYLRTFPNPTSGVINITGLTQPAKVKLYSIQGQLLKTEQQIQSKIDISDLPAGVYFLNLTTSDTVLKKTIIKR